MELLNDSVLHIQMQILFGWIFVIGNTCADKYIYLQYADWDFIGLVKISVEIQI